MSNAMEIDSVDHNNYPRSFRHEQAANDLRTILECLDLKGINNDAPPIIVDKIQNEVAKRFPLIEDSLLLPNQHILSLDQWKLLEQIEQQFINDYTIRREMLLKRCECTTASFCWKANGEIGNKEKQELEKVIEMLRKDINPKPNVSIVTALASRKSESIKLLNSFVSDTHLDCFIKSPLYYDKANRGTQQLLQLHKYIIDSVPDRGGRPNEQPIPHQETFSQQRQQRSQQQQPRHQQNQGYHRGGNSSGYRGGGHFAFNYNINIDNIFLGRGGGFPQRSHHRVQGAGWNQNPYARNNRF